MNRIDEMWIEAQMRYPQYDGVWNIEYNHNQVRQAFVEGVKWANKNMIDKACKCFCDNLCEKSLCGMCFHKYDGKQQIKNSFQYNECHELKLLRKVMEE